MTKLKYFMKKSEFSSYAEATWSVKIKKNYFVDWKCFFCQTIDIPVRNRMECNSGLWISNMNHSRPVRVEPLGYADLE